MRNCLWLFHEIKSWEEPLQGCRKKDSLPLSYNTKWLDASAKYLPKDWCTLHNTLSHSVVNKDKYRIMMFLSTLTYFQHMIQELVQTLLAFATVPELCATRPPGFPPFQLLHGYRPDKAKLIDMTNNRGRPFYLCLESNLPQFSHKTFADTDPH